MSAAIGISRPPRPDRNIWLLVAHRSGFTGRMLDDWQDERAFVVGFGRGGLLSPTCSQTVELRLVKAPGGDAKSWLSEEITRDHGEV